MFVFKYIFVFKHILPCLTHSFDSFCSFEYLYAISKHIMIILFCGCAY